MKKKCAIIGTDARLSFLKDTLDNEPEVKIFPTTIWTEELKAAIMDFQPTIIFLPIPPLQIDSSFVLPESCLLLFVGKTNTEIEQEIQNSQVHAFYYLEDEQWIWENANLTAEGFIYNFYRSENESIYNKKFIGKEGFLWRYLPSQICTYQQIRRKTNLWKCSVRDGRIM